MIDIDFYDSFHSYTFVDLDGNLVEKDKYNYQYSYDPYVVWKNNYLPDSSMVYSDRLMQWDFRKFNKCCLQVWNNEAQYFHSRQPKDIEKFLSLYFGKEIKLTVIMEGCNVSNGYPYWIFGFKEIKN